MSYKGLARAFLYAGSSALLVSLWQVHDRSTLHWMEHNFMRSLSVNGRVKVGSDAGWHSGLFIAASWRGGSPGASVVLGSVTFLMGETGKI